MLSLFIGMIVMMLLFVFTIGLHPRATMTSVAIFALMAYVAENYRWPVEYNNVLLAGAMALIVGAGQLDGHANRQRKAKHLQEEFERKAQEKAALEVRVQQIKSQTEPKWPQ